MPISLGTTTITALYLGTTSISSAYLGNTQVFGGSFTPLSLFSGGAQGIWLDPSDLSTMFSDRAGTTPVTAPGTVVGLRLDKSKGLTLGAELVVNGGFATDTDWTKGTNWTISGGEAVATAVASGQSVSQPIAAMTAGKSYRLTLTISSISGGIRPYAGTGGGYGTTVTASGTYSWTLLAGGTGGIYIATSGTTSATIDNISVRELAGNHATAPTDAARPVYGVEPKGGRRNLLTWSEGFVSPWVLTSTSLSGTSISGFSASVQFGDNSASRILRNPVNQTSGVAYVVSAFVEMDDGLAPVVGAASNTGDFSLVTDDNIATSPVVTRIGATNVYRVSATRTCAVTGARQTGVYRYTTQSARTFRVTGMQLEEASTATAYQRVTTAYDITESGVPSCHYVQYDGSDDSMSTAAIDFTATDKMSVFAGVRRTSATTSFALLYGHGYAQAGGFECFVPSGAATAMQMYMQAGSSADYTMPTAPVSFILTETIDRAALTSLTEMKVRLNGAVLTGTGSGNVTGNFGTYPLFFGRRGNVELPFNGRDYGIIVVGKAASAGEITDTETWLAAKTSGVTI